MSDNVESSGLAMGSIEPSSKESCIKNVWAHNLEEEMANIRAIVDKYCYISMDTEFPGVIARPLGKFKSTGNFRYQALRCNVDFLKIIQLGVSFSDPTGAHPPGVSTWQFNFKFNLRQDMYAQDSIDLLSKAGIDFVKHEEQGIEVDDFAELLTSSGCILISDIKWISFHSSYDFAYLLKILTCKNLPQDESGFLKLLKIYFPCIYDVKYLMTNCKNLKGGLQEVSDMLKIERIGSQHQAGSDSLLTGYVFFKLRQTFFDWNIDDSKYLGVLYGLSAGSEPEKDTQSSALYSNQASDPTLKSDSNVENRPIQTL